MKPVPLLLTFSFLLPVTALAASPLAKPQLRDDGLYHFEDTGRRSVKFRIAKDELQRSSNAGTRRLAITARSRLRQLQEDAKSLATGTERVELVAYEEGHPQTEQFRRVVSPKVSVTLNEGVSASLIAQAAGAKSLTPVFISPYEFIFEFTDGAEALTACEALRSTPGVLHASVMLGRKLAPTAVPTDPFLGSGNNGNYANHIYEDLSELRVTLNPIPLWRLRGETRAFQWYMGQDMLNPMLPPVFDAEYTEAELPSFVEPNPFGAYFKYFDEAVNINVFPAWEEMVDQDNPVDGSGVKVAVVDDGVYYGHRDFLPGNILKNDDYNFLGGTEAEKQNPELKADAAGSLNRHGTGMAAIILASSNNLGMAGVAPDARLMALRVLGGLVTDDVLAKSQVHGATIMPPAVTPTNPAPAQPTGYEWYSGVPKADIALNAWGGDSFGSTLQNSGRYFRKAMAYGVTAGRPVNGSAKGVIYISSAGNDGEYHGNVNYSWMTNNIYSVTVGSVSDLGRSLLYSAPGAALHVVAPSGGDEMAPRIAHRTQANTFVPASIPPVIPADHKLRSQGWTTTTDEWDHPDADPRMTQQILTATVPAKATDNAYDNNISGTSPSAAMAAGVVALMLEVNPELGWRDVQEILMRSARVVDPLMGEWEYNSAGMPMSHKYGAGIIDAHHAVRMARKWRNLGARAGIEGNTVGTAAYREVQGISAGVKRGFPIPDNAFTSVTKQEASIVFSGPPAGMRIEHVVVRLKVAHGRRGDLGITLIAPFSGQADKPVESYLYVPHREDAGADIGDPLESDAGGDGNVKEGEYWDFVSVRHWGTGPQNTLLDPSKPGEGSWTLKIWDNTKEGKTTVNMADNNPQKRVGVNVDNPSEPGRVVYADIIFHGSTAASENEPPVILSDNYIAKTGSFFKARVSATTDMTPDGLGEPRAPIEHYRVRVMGGVTPNAPELVIAPSTAEEYMIMYGNPAENPAHMRFDRTTGIFTTEPYPDAPEIPPFKPLPRHIWNLEIRATNVFGTTRRNATLNVRDEITYAQWRSIHFSPEDLQDPDISGDKADPDQDGMPNIMEYTSGGFPLTPEPELAPAIAQNGDSISVTYHVDTSTINYSNWVQSSTDLTNWTVVTPTGEGVPVRGTIEQRTVIVPATPGSRQFLRLRAGASPS